MLVLVSNVMIITCLVYRVMEFVRNINYYSETFLFCARILTNWYGSVRQ